MHRYDSYGTVLPLLILREVFPLLVSFRCGIGVLLCWAIASRDYKTSNVTSGIQNSVAIFTRTHQICILTPFRANLASLFAREAIYGYYLLDTWCDFLIFYYLCSYVDRAKIKNASVWHHKYRMTVRYNNNPNNLLPLLVWRVRLSLARKLR